MLAHMPTFLLRMHRRIARNWPMQPHEIGGVVVNDCQREAEPNKGGDELVRGRLNRLIPMTLIGMSPT